MAYKRSGKCVYCQSRPGISRDHVPPKNIFAKPRPSTLITVNSCEECNQGFKLDDEYLRAYITARADCLTPQKRQVQQTALRAFDNSPALKAKFFQDVRVVEKVRADLSIDFVFQMRHDEDRLERIMKRIVRGIIWDHSEILLPLDSHFCVLLDHGYEPGIRAKIDEKTQELLKGEEEREVGELFSYKFGMVDERSNASIWQLRFFTELWCLVYVNLEDVLVASSRN